MNVVSILCVVCIVIKVVNILLHNRIKKTSVKVKKWSNTINTNRSYLKTSKLYCKNYSDNIANFSTIYGRSDIDVLKIDMKEYVDNKYINQDSMKLLFMKMKEDVSNKKFILYLFSQAINIIYTGIAVALVFLLPFPAGTILFVLLMGLSVFQYKANNSIQYLYLIDAFVCICMFLMVLFVF